MKLQRMLTVLLITGLYGCSMRSADRPLTLQEQRVADRLLASFEVQLAQSVYLDVKEETAAQRPEIYPEFVAEYTLRGFPTKGDSSKALEQAFTQPEAKEYMSFMKAQVRRWQRNEISWEEVDHQIIAKGNEIKRRFEEEFSREAQLKELKNQTRIQRSLSAGLGFLCQDAIARGDRGALMVHC